MTENKIHKEISLGGYTTQLLNYGNVFSAFPVKTTETMTLKEEETSA